LDDNKSVIAKDGFRPYRKATFVHGPDQSGWNLASQKLRHVFARHVLGGSFRDRFGPSFAPGFGSGHVKSSSVHNVVDLVDDSLGSVQDSQVYVEYLERIVYSLALQEWGWHTDTKKKLH
jgi:hypothetical protein